MIFRLISSIIIFFGGIACIITSINISNTYAIQYNNQTSGIVTYIDSLQLAFLYKYVLNNISYIGGWLPNDVFDNKTIIVQYDMFYPNCSIIENIPGIQMNLFGLNDNCSYFYYTSPWFWPFLMSVGTILIIGGSIVGGNIILKYCFFHL